MKFKLLCLIVLFSPLAGAEEINVADHGVVPGQDAAFPLHKLLESVRDESDVTLVFPKAAYDFYPENAVEMYRAVANHDNGLKRMGFPLFNCKDITIDGGGSVFMFHGRMVPFTLESVQGAVLKNFSIDWTRSFHAELTVVESNENDQSFVVETDPQLYPYYNVHGPHQGRKDLVEHFEDKGLADKQAHYAAMVKAVDESVGRVRDAIKKKGIETNRSLATEPMKTCTRRCGRAIGSCWHTAAAT